MAVLPWQPECGHAQSLEHLRDLVSISAVVIGEHVVCMLWP